MTLASDLAAIVCAGTIVQPGYVHDPAHPLVVGDTDAGEFGVFSFNPLNRMVEIKAASDIEGAVGTFSFGPNGQFLINGSPLPGSGDIGDAVERAEDAADAAEASANSAGASATQAASSLTQVQTIQAGFQAQADTAIQETAENATDAATAAALAASSADAAEQVVDTVTTLAGQAASSASASSTSAANAAGSAAQALGVASESRFARTRAVTADQTFEPGHLFTRGRCNFTGTKTLTIPPSIFVSTEAKEAWASFRLETGTALNFAGGGGSGTLVPPALGTGSGAAVVRGRRPVVETLAVFPGVISVPAVTSGKLVIMAGMTFNAADLPGPDATIALGSGLVATRRMNVNAATLSFVPDFAIWDVELVSFAGGDVSVNISAGPSVQLLLATAFILTNVGVAAPIFNKTTIKVDASFQEVTLTGVPDAARILTMAVQRGGNASGAAFVSWSSNVTGLTQFNTYGALNGTNDAHNFYNGIGASASGVKSGAGNATIRSTFVFAGTEVGIAAVAYPSAGGTTVAVTIKPRGGRTSLTVAGGEAVLWFDPDGRTVYLDCPAT